MPQLCKAKKLNDSPIIFINAGRFSQWTSEQGPAHPALQKSLPQVSSPGQPSRDCTLQRHNNENSKQIFTEKELRGLSPNFYIHVSVSDYYIPMIGLLILLQENMRIDPGNI